MKSNNNTAIFSDENYFDFNKIYSSNISNLINISDQNCNEIFDNYLYNFIKDNVTLSLYYIFINNNNNSLLLKKISNNLELFLDNYCIKLSNLVFFFIKNDGYFLKYQKEISLFENWEISIIENLYFNYKIFYFKDKSCYISIINCISTLSFYFFKDDIYKEKSDILKKKKFLFTKIYQPYFDYLITKINLINSLVSRDYLKINTKLSTFLSFFLFISLSPTHNLSQIDVMFDESGDFSKNFFFDENTGFFWVNSFSVINTFSNMIYKFDMYLTFLLYLYINEGVLQNNNFFFKNTYYKQKDDFFLKKLIKHVLFVLSCDNFLEKKKNKLNGSTYIEEVTSIIDSSNFFLNSKEINIKEKLKKKKKTLTFYSFFKKKSMFSFNFFNNLKLNKFFFFHDYKNYKNNRYFNIVSFFNIYFSFSIDLFSYCINSTFLTIENFFRKNLLSGERVENISTSLINKMFNTAYKLNFNFIEKEIEFLELGFSMSRFDLFMNKHLDFFFKNKYIIFNGNKLTDLNILLFYSQFVQIFFYKNLYSCEIFISNFFDFRARRYYNSMVGFTSFKLFRYMYTFNFKFSKCDLILKLEKFKMSNVYLILNQLDSLDSFLKKFESYFNNFQILNNLLGDYYYNIFRKLFIFFLINLSKIFKKKFSYSVHLYKFLEYGVEVVFYFFNKNGELNLIYKNEQLEDEHRWLLQTSSLFLIDLIGGDLNCFNFFFEKDSTASMSQLMSLILGLNNNNIIINNKKISTSNIVNVGSIDCQVIWYDYYSFVLMLFKKKMFNSFFFKKFNSTQINLFLQRSLFKKAIMTKSYGVTRYTMYKSLQESFLKKKILYTHISKCDLMELSNIFYSFLETDLEKFCYKKNSKELIKFFEKKMYKRDFWHLTPDGVKFFFVYFNIIQKRFDIKKIIRYGKSKKILLRKTHSIIKLSKDSFDLTAIKNSVRANTVHSIDAYTIRYVCLKLDNLITIHDCFLVSFLDIPFLLDYYQQSLVNVNDFYKNNFFEDNLGLNDFSIKDVSTLFVLL